MKKLKLFGIATLFSSLAYAQVDKAPIKVNHVYITELRCEWVNKTDSIPVDYVVISDNSGYTKNIEAEWMVHKYESKECNIESIENHDVRNEVIEVNGIPTHVLKYRHKRGYLLSVEPLKFN